jgi:hypothetical protein
MEPYLYFPPMHSWRGQDQINLFCLYSLKINLSVELGSVILLQRNIINSLFHLFLCTVEAAYYNRG